MKKTLILPAFFFSVAGFTQSLTPEVIGNSGDFFLGSGASLSWTLGEIMTETYSGTSNQLTQGFQQPIRILSEVNEITNPVFIQVYPNPTQAVFTLLIPGNQEQLAVIIYNSSGELILNDFYSGQGPKDYNLEPYASGMYFIQIRNSDGSIVETLKIQKTL